MGDLMREVGEMDEVGGIESSVIQGAEVACAGGCGSMTPSAVIAGRLMPAYCEACLKAAERDEAAAEAGRVLARRMAESGVTERMRPWTLYTWPGDPETVEAVQRWVEEPESALNLYLFGPVGTGKSGLAWGAVRWAIEHWEWRAKFVNWRHLLGVMRDSIQAKREQADETGREVALVYNLPIVALDDLGTERPTEWAREELLNLIDWRYEQRKRTIVTSNYTPDDLAARLGYDDPAVGERIVSRLMEDCVAIPITGGDRRVT